MKGCGRAGEDPSLPWRNLLYRINGLGRLRGMGEGLAGSTGGGPLVLWVGLGGAGSIVVLLAHGVSALNPCWSERVGEVGGGGFSSSVAVSIM